MVQFFMGKVPTPTAIYYDHDTRNLLTSPHVRVGSPSAGAVTPVPRWVLPSRQISNPSVTTMTQPSPCSEHY